VARIRHALDSSRQLITANVDFSTLPALKGISPPYYEVQETDNAENTQTQASSHRPMVHEEPTGTALVPSLSVSEISSHLDEDEEEMLAEEGLEEEFDNSAQDLWENIRVVSRKVLRYASDFLRSTEYETVTSRLAARHLELPTAEAARTLPDERPTAPTPEASDRELSPAETDQVASPIGSDSVQSPSVSMGDLGPASRPPDNNLQKSEPVDSEPPTERADTPGSNIFFKGPGGSCVIPFDEMQAWEVSSSYMCECVRVIH
jgi:hypothetical protein